ncbi:MAG: hypothetical protein EHJ95_05260 [Methanobacteriota archaeon]|nr:MAG: hypothetical protein EHJ95_05260 [Euryarchaeota archaeon]
MVDTRVEEIAFVQFSVIGFGPEQPFIDSSEITSLDREILGKFNIFIADQVLIYNGVSLYRNTAVYRHCILEKLCCICPGVSLSEGTRVRKGEVRVVRKQAWWKRIKTRISLIGAFRPIKPKRPPSKLSVGWRSLKRLVRSWWPQRSKFRSNSK